MMLFNPRNNAASENYHYVHEETDTQCLGQGTEESSVLFLAFPPWKSPETGERRGKSLHLSVWSMGNEGGPCELGGLCRCSFSRLPGGHSPRGESPGGNGS